jgi:phosphonate transport system substrate-binding protein
MTLLLGAVAYDPKVVTIWEGFCALFARHGLDVDYVLYSHYERQVEALFSGQVHVAWNSPLAHLQTERLAAKAGRQARAFCMRDSDQDLTSLVLVRRDDPAQTLADLKGRVVAVGAVDSPQATLLPLGALARAGLQPGVDVTVKLHDVLRGKHGDHIGGERDAVRALVRGEADAACVIDGNHLLFTREGTLAPGAVRTLYQTPPYDHCVFSALDTAPQAEVARLKELLLGMSYDDPEARPLLDLEGLKQWREGRTSGLAQLDEAITRLGSIDAWLSEAAARL